MLNNINQQRIRGHLKNIRNRDKSVQPWDFCTAFNYTHMRRANLNKSGELFLCQIFLFSCSPDSLPNCFCIHWTTSFFRI